MHISGLKFDHVHWTIINGQPLDDKMGKTTNYDTAKHNGKVVLVGRGRTGHHHNLTQFVSPQTYLAKLQGLNIIELKQLHPEIFPNL